MTINYGWRLGTLLSLLCLSSIATVADHYWSVPQKGWIYALDANIESDQGHILLIDPLTRLVRGTIVVGKAPEYSVAPDGSMIFVISGSVDRGTITGYNANSGQEVVAIDVQDRTLATTWPLSSDIAISRDGRWLFITTMKTMALGIDDYNILRFAVTKTAITRAGRASLPACGSAHLMPTSGSAWDLLVHCPFSNVARLIRFDSDGLVTQFKDIELPSRPFDPSYGQTENKALITQGIVYTGQDNYVFALTGKNEVCRLNTSDGTGPCSSLEQMQGRWIPQRPWVYSRDGRFLYLGTNAASEHFRGNASSIIVVDTATMKSVSTISLHIPFRMLAIDADAGILYAVNPEAQAIMQVDIASGKEKETIATSEFYPTSVMVVP